MSDWDPKCCIDPVCCGAGHTDQEDEIEITVTADRRSSCMLSDRRAQLLIEEIVDTICSCVVKLRDEAKDIPDLQLQILIPWNFPSIGSGT